jgi:arsenite/tail-anchored protein-transporting ATPase
VHFLERRVVLITGKGGVGKTTVAVAVARAASAAGKRVLLAEVGDPEGGYSAIGRRFGREAVSSEPELVGPNLWLGHLWSRTGHERFLSGSMPSSLARAAVRSKSVAKFLTAAPSFHEMGVFYHLLTLLRAERRDGTPMHELVVVDMPATGHALALTGLPQILLRLIPKGPIARLLKEGQSYLNDPLKGEAWVVTLPEQLPISECLELLDGLKETEMPAGGVVLNRYPDDPFTTAERRALDVLLAQRSVHGELEYRRIGAAHAAAGRLLEGVGGVPVITLPEIYGAMDPDPVPKLTEAMRHAMEGARG